VTALVPEDVGRPHGYEQVSETDVYRHLNARLVDLVALPAGATVLDLGCGTGSLSELLVARSDATLWAADPDPSMVAAARRVLGDRVHVVEGSAVTFGEQFDDASLDAVFLANVIHLVPDIPALITEVHRVLRPGGWLAFNTAFFEGAEDPADRPLYWRLLLDARKLAPRSPNRTAERPLAKRPNTATSYREQLGAHHFAAISATTSTVALGPDLLKAIVSSPMFAAGAMPGVDPDDAAAALASTVTSMATARPGLSVRRTWLYMSARKLRREATTDD
jgi:ubiquinone/menaquinone biosynthesis C-methylase UbiE